jgi:hypothetical protein
LLTLFHGPVGNIILLVAPLVYSGVKVSVEAVSREKLCLEFLERREVEGEEGFRAGKVERARDFLEDFNEVRERDNGNGNSTNTDWFCPPPPPAHTYAAQLCGQVPINHHYTFTSSTNFYTLTHLYNLLLIRHSFLRQNARVFETPLYLPPNGWPAFKGSDREGGRLIRSLKETNEYVEQIAKICEIKVKRASWMDRKAPSPKQMPVTQKKR